MYGMAYSEPLRRGLNLLYISLIQRVPLAERQILGTQLRIDASSLEKRESLLFVEMQSSANRIEQRFTAGAETSFDDPEELPDIDILE